MTDLRYAVRQLLKSPGFSAVAILTLALGIGACTTLFSVVDGVLLRPLPFPDAAQLIMIWETNAQQGVKREGPSGPDFYDWREQSRSFQDLAAVELGSGTVTGLGEPQQVPALRVTTNLFSVLAVQPALGRLFAPEDGRGGRQAFVILSHDFWQRALGGDPAVIGKSVRVDQIAYQVIGVLDRGFWLPFASDLYVPWPDDELRFQRGRLAHDLGVFGRLKPGLTAPQAEAELHIVQARLRRVHPELEGWTPTVVPLGTAMVESIRPALLVLSCAGGFVLLLACTNVANLLLARATGRRQEIAVRLALGASRGRLLRQLLTESLVLSLAAGALGTLLAVWGVSLLSALVPTTIPLPDAGADVTLRPFGIDGQVLAFTLGLSLLTGLLFGLVPAVQALKIDLIESLKQGSPGAVGGGRRLREALLVAEVALALVLLTGAGLMLQSFLRLQRADLGFLPDRLLTVEMELPTDTRYRDGPQQSAFFTQVLERVQSLPGAKSAALTSVLPLHPQDQRTRFLIERGPSLPPDERLQSDLRRVSPGYFQTMGISLKAGRPLQDHDSAGANAPRVGLVDEAFVRRFFGHENPLGRHLLFERGRLEIVGIVGDVKHAGADREVRPTLYVSFLQNPTDRMNLLLRTTAEPAAFVPDVKRAIWSIDRDQPIYRIESMAEVVAEATRAPRLSLVLLGLFAATALALAAVGVYGVMAYTVSQLTRELGIRLALGARPAHLLVQVLRRGMLLVGLGLTIGLAASFALGRLIQSLLYRTNPHDSLILGAIATLLAAVALFACYLPSRRATKVDPLTALRSE